MSSLLSKLALLFGSLVAVNAQSNLLINTTNGMVQGVLTGNNGINPSDQVRFWMSIPYAAPPIGDLRFHAPQPAASWSNTLVTNPSSLIPACPQVTTPGYNITEDCLVLHVTAPLNTSSTLLPVMVWIHGGSLKTGAGGSYNGSAIVAENNVIFVSINYRLGLLGFIGSSEIVAANGTYNAGFLDQRAALQWVQANIAAFGGDPSQVTIWGESAGALSVAAHLTSPLTVKDSPRLFERGIAHSLYEPDSYMSAQGAEFLYQQTLLQTTCSSDMTVQCLQSLPWQTLVNSPLIALIVSFPLTIDGNIIAGTARDQMQKGQWAKVPFIMGSNADEYALFLCPPLLGASYASANAPVPQLSLTQVYEVLGSDLTSPTLIQDAVTFYETKIPNVTATYRQGGDYNWDLLVDLTTDFIFACEVNSVVDYASMDLPGQVYMYHMEYFSSDWSNQCLRIAHAVGDLPLFFPPTGSIFGVYTNYSRDEIQLGAALRASWATFAKTSKPSTDDISFSPYCSSSSSCEATYLDIDSATMPYTQTKTNFKQAQCDFWQSEHNTTLEAVSTLGPHFQVRVTALEGQNCAATSLFSATVQNGTCTAYQITPQTVPSLASSVVVFFIASCPLYAQDSSWSTTFYSDPDCSTPISSTPASASSFNACGYQTGASAYNIRVNSTAADGTVSQVVIPSISAVVDCSGATPITGVLSIYSMTEQASCGASTGSSASSAPTSGFSTVIPTTIIPASSGSTIIPTSISSTIIPTSSSATIIPTSSSSTSSSSTSIPTSGGSTSSSSSSVVPSGGQVEFINGGCLPLTANVSATIACQSSAVGSPYVFTLYQDSTTCSGTPALSYKGSGASDCVPYVNLKFNCGGVIASQPATVAPTVTTPTLIPEPSTPPVARQNPGPTGQ